MQEVTIRLEFNRECLGAVKVRRGNQTIFAFCRDPDNRIMFLATWWRAILRHAAKTANRHQDLINQINWDPTIEGRVSQFRRYITAERQQSKQRFAVHEAFVAGTVITVNAVLPDGITIDDFWSLLQMAGTYCGISPFKPAENYGTFRVLNITNRNRNWDAATKSAETPQDIVMK